MSSRYDVDIVKYIKQYTDEVERELANVIKDVGREAVKKLKLTSPKRTGNYAKSWTFSFGTNKGITRLRVYNEEYRLTHLLEDGHEVSNNQFAYAQGKEHIKPVNDWAQEEVVKRMEEVLSK